MDFEISHFRILRKNRKYRFKIFFDIFVVLIKLYNPTEFQGPDHLGYWDIAMSYIMNFRCLLGNGGHFENFENVVHTSDMCPITMESFIKLSLHISSAIPGQAFFRVRKKKKKNN